MTRSSGPRIRVPATGDARLDSGLRELSQDIREQAARMDRLENAPAAPARKPSTLRVSKDLTGGVVTGSLAAVSGSGADAAINNALAELQAQIDRMAAVLREQGAVQ